MTLDAQSLNLNARQILLKRLSTAQALAYTGPLGEVVIDTNLKLLRIQDGVTPGGVLMATSANIAHLQSQINSILNNIDPAALDSLSEVVANVNALLANNIESQLVNSGFYANLSNTGNLTIDGSLLPKTHLAQDLGSPTRAWRDLYISNATAYFGNAAVTVTSNGLTVSMAGNVLPVIANVRFPDGTTQRTAVDMAVLANIYTLLTPNVSANLNTIHTDVTNAISYFGNITSAAVSTLQANLQAQINYIKTNIDPVALDSLTEIVASFQNIDANIVSNIGTLGNTVANLVATQDRLTSGNVQMLLTAGAQPSVQFPVGPGGRIIISEAEITALSGNLSLSSMGDAYILTNGDGAAPGAGKLWKFDRSGNLTLPRGSLKRDVINGFLTVEGPLYTDFVTGSGGGINTISNGVKLRTHRVVDDVNHDWDFAWDGAVYPPYDAASSQVGAIEWRKSGNVSSQIKYTLGSTVNDVVIPPGLIVNNYAGAGGFTIKADSGAGGSGASKYWTFNPDGSMTTPGLLKSGNIQVGTNIYGSSLGGISDAIQLRPNISIDKRFLFTVDSGGGAYIRSGMEMPMAEVDKPVTLGFPHNNSTSGYIFNQGTDTNGTEWNDALVIFQNGGNVKIGTITNSNGTKIWEFNQTGNLTLPQTNMNASPAPVSLPGITFTDGTFQTTAYTGAAAKVDILNTNGLSNTFYPTFVEFRTTGQYVRADVDFTYRSDSNTLTVPKIAGMLQGNVNHDGGYINFTGSPSPVSTGITFADGTSQTTAYRATFEQKFDIKSTGFGVVVNTRYGVNTASGAVIATLPASPSLGDAVFFADAGGAFSTNSLTIARNGNTIMGSAADIVINTNGDSLGLFWNGTTWRLYE